MESSNRAFRYSANVRSPTARCRVVASRSGEVSNALIGSQLVVVGILDWNWIDELAALGGVYG